MEPVTAANPGDGPGLWGRLKGVLRGADDEHSTVRAPGGSSGADTLVALARAHASGATGPVAVLVDVVGDSDGLAALLRETTGGPVLEFDAASPSEAHIRLTALGPFALIVDDVEQRASRARRFQDVFHHLAPGGVLVVRDVSAEAVDEPHPDKKGLGGLLGAVEVARKEGRPEQGKPGSPPPANPVLVRQDAWFLAEAIETVERVDGHLVVTSRGSGALAKIG